MVRFFNNYFVLLASFYMENQLPLCSWHRVISPLVEGMTAAEASHSQPDPLRQTMSGNSLIRILRTGRSKSAGMQRDLGQGHLIKLNET